MNGPNTFWALSITDLLTKLNKSESGLSEDEVLQRIKTLKSVKVYRPLRQEGLLLLKQFKSPLVLILICCGHSIICICGIYKHRDHSSGYYTNTSGWLLAGEKDQPCYAQVA
jgi:hypothetical protein